MSSGLDDVVAAETALSDVDGLAGRLIVRGHSLDEIAGRVPFADVAAMLLDGLISPVPDTAALGAARAEMFDRFAPRLTALSGLSGFDAMRSAIALLPDGTDAATATALLAAPAILVPALVRLGQGEAPVAPVPGAPHAADILAMLRGRAPSAAEAGALDTYLVTVADHGLNASTFTARVVASTQAGLVSSTLAALGALKGPLHGGAPGPVLDMIDAVGRPDRAEPVLRDMLARGERLPGFGHRVYRVRDPRADALKGALLRLPPSPRMTLALAVEAAALTLLREKKPGRVLETNVEFFTALLLDALDLPREMFTAVFAIGRMAGWIAHAREQALSGRVIRPKSLYVGQQPLAAA